MQISTNAIVSVGTTYKGSTNLYDILAARIDTSGNQVWTQTWDYANLNDGAVNLWNSGTRIYIAGGAQSAATTYKYAVVNVKLSDGSIQGATTTGGTAFGYDQLTDIQYDANGYIYLTGGVINTGTIYDIKTVKLDTALNIIWSATYASSGAYNDVGTGLAIDQVGNVIVTGYRTSATTGQDYVTIKYSSGGTQRWASTWDGGLNLQDSATAIVVSPTDTNKIYVTGSTYNGSSKDYWTIKYDGLGNQKWAIGFNNLSNTDDRATSIAVDTLGNVIVAGQNKLAWNSPTYITVKYVEVNTTLPQDTISATSNSFVFNENRGQLFGSDSAVHPEVKFYTITGKPQVYFTDTAVSYVFAHVDTITTTDSIVRVNMTFKNANANLKIRAMDQRTEVTNYYYDFIPGGAREQVHNYEQLVSFNVWNNVDMIYGSNLKGLKYYFVCNPGGGGNPATQIDLLYKGADSVRINGSGQLVIYTRLGTIVQPKASAWQLDGSGNFSSLGWQPNYTLLGTNEVGFTSFGSFNTAYPLIIAVDWGDIFPVSIQNLDWSTYYGGSGQDLFWDVDVNQVTGNTYYAGTTTSMNFPNHNGYQVVNSGGSDAVAVEIDSVGVWKFSTYYGTGPVLISSANQTGKAGAVASNGNFTIGGNTVHAGVDIGFPNQQPSGAYIDATFGGSFDAYFAQFAEGTGTLLWSTYYGSTGFENILDLQYDKDDNLYAVLDADTNTPRVFKVGAYNDSSARNGMIMKFDMNLNLIWATMYGTVLGPAHGLAYDVTNLKLYVVGRAQDTTLPMLSSGIGAYFDTTLNGTTDAFISKFNAADTLVWSTLIGGSTNEIGYDAATYNGDVVLLGSTNSVDFPCYHPSGEYIDSTRNGTDDIFIARFNSADQRLWSTYYGGNLYELGAAVNGAFDYSGNLYIASNTESTDLDLVNAPSVYYDSTCDCGSSTAGDWDGFYIAFNPQNQLVWGTYFGGTTADMSTGIAIFRDSLMYVSGYTVTSNTAAVPWPTQQLSGAFWQPNYSGSSDATLTRFTLDPLLFIGVEEHLVSSDTSGTLLVYPNPSSGQFQIIVNSEASNKRLDVYNSLGQLVKTVALDDNLKNQSVSLNLSEEATGVYVIVLQEDNASCSQRIIKQ